MQVAAQAPTASTLRMYRWLILGNAIVLRTFRNFASRSALRGRLGASNGRGEADAPFVRDPLPAEHSVVL